MFNTNQDRREAVRKIIQHLPRSLRPYLDDLFRAAETDPSRETELYSALRSTLNTLTIQGVLPRRSFLQIAGLVVTGGLGPLLYPEKAHAWQAWTGFWQNIQTNSYFAPTNTGTDPYWDYVVLLMNFDGSNGSTVFADESNVGKTPTITGTPYIDTSSSPYSGGKGSGRFNGSTDFVSVPASSDLVFSGDFTIETWIYPRSISGGQAVFSSVAIGSSWNGTGGMFLANNAGILEFRTNAIDLTAGSSNLSINTWYHVAVVRSGSGSNNIKVYLNGSLLYQGTDTATLGSASVAPAIGIVDQASGSRWFFNGSLADLRIYNGVAKYTAAFTPATAPIGLGSSNDPNWGYCVLACPFENTLKDMSGKRPTATGSTLSTSTKKFGTASGSFSGSSQDLNVPTDSSLDGYGDFTIEAWIYGTSWGSNVTIASKLASSWSSTAFHFGVNNNGKLYFNASSNGSSWDIVQSNGAGATTLSLNTWYHVAVTRKGSTVYFFVNGSLDATVAASSTQMVASSAPVYIGSSGPNGAYFYGYIDSLRITKGYARYTLSFTPPTAAYPVGRDETVDPFWTNTVLAMHMDDLTDATGRYGSITANSTSISTSVTKFGSGSASFNGSSNFLETTWKDYLTADFTIEAWVRLPSTSANQAFVYAYDGGTTSNFLLEQTSGTLRFLLINDSGSTNADFSSGTIPGGCWNHVAVSVMGSSALLFINGIKVATATLANSRTYTGSTLRVGRHRTGADRYLNGYIDDLRITKGVARYSANFTPPTRAFATTPVSTYSEYDPFWSSVVLLISGQGPNGSTAISDLSSSPKTLSINGDTKVSTSVSSPFGESNGILSLDGSGDYIGITPNTNFGQTTDYTVEGWFNWTGNASGTDFQALCTSNAGSTGNRGVIIIPSSSVIGINEEGSGTVATTTISQNVWNHFAMVRSGTTVTLYLNGKSTGTSTQNPGNAAGTTQVGYFSSTRYFQGYLSNFRVTKGVARYTASFAPPRNALPASAGIVTSGLVACLDAGDASSCNGNVPSTGSQTFSYTGSTQTFTVPSGCTSISFKAWGAGGGGGFMNSNSMLGGGGAYASGTIPVTPGDSIVVGVGQGGAAGSSSAFGGGGASAGSNAASGGGRSWISLNGTEIITLGAGGGAAYLNAGAGGSTGENGSGCYPGGGGATASAGGSAGGGDTVGSAGSFHQGGNGGAGSNQNGAGGGGGYYGGGGGGGANGSCGGSGGGGSSYLAGSVSGSITSGSGQTPGNSGDSQRNGAGSGGNAGSAGANGLVILSWNNSGSNLKNIVQSPADSSSSSAYDFKFGDGSTSSSYPSFVGIAGGRSANDYFSFDGGDYFTLNGSNTTFINSLHKGTQAFTLIFVANRSSGGVNSALWSMQGNNDNSQGTTFRYQADGTIALDVKNGTTTAIYKASDSAVPFGVNHFMAISIDPAGTGFLYVDGSYLPSGSANTWSAAYSSPSSSNATNTVTLMSMVAYNRMPADSRMSLMMLYNRALTKAELDQNFAAIRGRFGI